MESISWKKCINNLISGIWIYTLAIIIASILSFANLIDILSSGWGLTSILYSVLEGESYQEVLSQFTSPTMAIVEKIIYLFVIVGYVLFFVSICRWVKLQENETDRNNVCKVKRSYIFLLLSVISAFIPIIGWLVSLVLVILSYINLLGGFKGLEKSNYLPCEVKNGARKIWAANVWMLVGAIISSIPIVNLIGSPIASIINIVAFFVILRGWTQIKNGFSDSPRYESMIGIAGFVLALLGLIFCWVPGLGLIFWLFGLVFSIIGMFKKPKSFAIAGLAISSILIIFILITFAQFAAVASFM